jgi:cell division protein FtsW (lipid II flippase)
MKWIRYAPDPWLYGLSLAATLAGLFLIWDSGYAQSIAKGESAIPPAFFKQLLFLGPAILAALVLSVVSADRLRRLGWPLLGLSVLGLGAVMMFGSVRNDAQRWLALGPITVQPSEFAKLFIVMWLASMLAHRKDWKGPRRVPRGLGEWIRHVGAPKLDRAWPLAIVVGLVVMIEKQPSLGSAMVVAAAAFAVLVAARVSWPSLAMLALVGLVGAWALVHQEDYRLRRIENHAQRWERAMVDSNGFQTTQSETAMALGGVTGVGLGRGRAKHVVPETTNDFVLTTAAEEFGVVGSFAVIALLGGIVWRLVRLAKRAADPYRALVLIGIAAWIGVQTCTNVMMANGTIMPIGIPLPFVSYGGSALIALWAAMGVAQAMAAAPSRSTEPAPVRVAARPIERKAVASGRR